MSDSDKVRYLREEYRATVRRVEASAARGIEFGGGGGDSGDMPPTDTDRRLNKLDDEMTEVKDSLQRLEVLTTAIGSKLDSTLPNLATKADVAALQALDPRLASVERMVVSKVPGWLQMLTMFAAMLAMVTALSNVSAGRMPWEFRAPVPEWPGTPVR